MPGRSRITVPGIPRHIIQRVIIAVPAFKLSLLSILSILGEQARKYSCAVHSYVMLTNHVHLLCKPQHENSAALLMKNLGKRYVQYVIARTDAVALHGKDDSSHVWRRARRML